MLPKRMASGQRLCSKHVEGCAGKVIAIQGRYQCFINNMFAATDIDDVSIRWEMSQSRCAQNILRG